MKKKPIDIGSLPTDPSNVEFEVWQDGMIVASCSGPEDDARREALHCAAMYAQDGPTILCRVDRTVVKPNA